MFKQKNTPTKQPPQMTPYKEYERKKVVKNLHLTRLRYILNHRQEQRAVRGEIVAGEGGTETKVTHTALVGSAAWLGWPWAALAEILSATANSVITELLSICMWTFPRFNPKPPGLGWALWADIGIFSKMLWFFYWTSVFPFGTSWPERTRLGSVMNLVIWGAFGCQQDIQEINYMQFKCIQVINLIKCHSCPRECFQLTQK